MKNRRTLFDLCMVREGARNGKTVKITAMSYLRPCDDKERRMEDLLLQTSEYILLRGKGDGSWPGLLREVSIVPVRRLDGQVVIKLHDSLPEAYQENAVFMMNVVTLHELRSVPGAGKLLTHEGDGDFRLLDKPIVLCDSMPCTKKGSVPILYGDFSRICIEDCGRGELWQECRSEDSGNARCAMTGYLNFTLEDRQAVWGMKLM